MEITGDDLRPLARQVKTYYNTNDLDIPLSLAIASVAPGDILNASSDSPVLVAWSAADGSRHALAANKDRLIHAVVGSDAETGSSTIYRRDEVYSVSARTLTEREQYGRDIDWGVTEWEVVLRDGTTFAMGGWDQPIARDRATEFLQALLP